MSGNGDNGDNGGESKGDKIYYSGGDDLSEEGARKKAHGGTGSSCIVSILMVKISFIALYGLYHSF